MNTSHDESSFTLTGKVWSAHYPIEELPKWLAFYRSRRERCPKAGNSYEATIAALEALEAQLAAGK